MRQSLNRLDYRLSLNNFDLINNCFETVIGPIFELLILIL